MSTNYYLFYAENSKQTTLPVYNAETGESLRITEVRPVNKPLSDKQAKVVGTISDPTKLIFLESPVSHFERDISGLPAEHKKKALSAYLEELALRVAERPQQERVAPRGARNPTNE